jgi:hypothetical protein
MQFMKGEVMLFHIYETYNCDTLENEAPYPGCMKVKGFRIDRRTVNHPAKLKCMTEQDWYTQGNNHRIVKGMIERDFEDEFYVIEINTVEDLLNFQSKYEMNATVSHHGSSYVYNGEELNSFYYDYRME